MLATPISSHHNSTCPVSHYHIQRIARDCELWCGTEKSPGEQCDYLPTCHPASHEEPATQGQTVTKKPKDGGRPLFNWAKSWDLAASAREAGTDWNRLSMACSLTNLCVWLELILGIVSNGRVWLHVKFFLRKDNFVCMKY